MSDDDVLAQARCLPRRRQLSWLLLICAAFGCFACDAPAANPKGAAPQKAPVVIGQVTDKPMEVVRRYLGEVWAASDARLSVAEPGRVLRVHVEEGAVVKKGQVLLELDDRLARAELSEALAQRKRGHVQSGQAGIDAERYTLLEQEQAVSQLEAERERSEAASLQAEKASLDALVDARRERVSRHRLVAPFDGTISSRAVDPGDWLSPGQPALGLLTERRLEVLVRVPPSLLDRVEDIKGVTIESEGRATPAQLLGSVGSLSRGSRTGLLRVEPEAAPDWLRAGASADVAFDLVRGGLLNLPADAVVQGAISQRIFRVLGPPDALTVEPLDVEVVETGGDRVLVRAEGLAAGDRVVVKGNERLRPEQAVTTSGVTGSVPNASAQTSAEESK